MKFDNEVLAKIRKYERKRDIRYLKTSDGWYRAMLILAFIAWLYASIMSLFYILGRSLLMSTTDSLSWDNRFVTLLCAFCVTVLTPVIYAFRAKITAMIICLCGMIIQLFCFIGLSSVDGSSVSSNGVSTYDEGIFGLKKMFYWRHGIPVAAFSILIILLVVFAFRERSIMKKEYNKIRENEYTSEILSNDE